MPLTKEQKENYVKTGGVKCPYCDSYDIEGGSFECDASYVTQEVACNNCERHWTDEYTMTAIHEE
jgi:transposase-like protein